MPENSATLSSRPTGCTLLVSQRSYLHSTFERPESAQAVALITQVVPVRSVQTGSGLGDRATKFLNDLRGFDPSDRVSIGAWPPRKT